MWWVLILIGVLVVILSGIAQVIQPQPTFWELWKSAIFGMLGGTAGGGALLGLQIFGFAIFGPIIGLPVVATMAVLGGIVGPGAGRLFGEDTYGGNWQTFIDIGYGLGAALVLVGIVTKVFY